MIYKLTFKEDDNRIDWCQAKSQLHLLQSYDEEYDDFQDIKEVVEITEEEAKNTMLKNTDYQGPNDEDNTPEISLYDLVVGDNFAIVGSTDWE